MRQKAPRVGFANSIAMCTLVVRALVRTGVDAPHKGAHLFRHTLATAMLRQGASLAEIGELLRHQSPQTTAIDAKVDLAALRTLAAPWPDGARGEAPRAALGGDSMTSTPSLAVVWERGCTQRLRPPRQTSPHTISASRDTFRLRLLFTQPRLRKPPARLALTDIDAPLIVAFLAEMEQSRGLAPRRRHLR